jgi:hypothetical protein
MSLCAIFNHMYEMQPIFIRSGFCLFLGGTGGLNSGPPTFWQVSYHLHYDPKPQKVLSIRLLPRGQIEGRFPFTGYAPFSEPAKRLPCFGGNLYLQKNLQLKRMAKGHTRQEQGGIQQGRGVTFC